MIQITFMRHGRSLADDEGKFEGRYDSPLTAAGREQIRTRARQWQAEGKTFNLVVASTLSRAQESARIVAEALNAPVELDPDWMEIDHGKIGGLTYSEGDRLYPRPVFRTPYDVFGVTGETEYRLHSRAALALERVIHRGEGSYLVVAHGGILNAAIRHLMNVPVPVNRSGIWFAFGDGGFARFRYTPEDHRWVMLELAAGIAVPAPASQAG